MRKVEGTIIFQCSVVREDFLEKKKGEDSSYFKRGSLSMEEDMG